VYKLKYKNFKFDIIIATDNNAFDFMRRYRDELFPGTPVVFCGVNYFQEVDTKKLKLFTGVNEEKISRPALSYSKTFTPGTREIMLSTNGQPPSKGS